MKLIRLSQIGVLFGAFMAIAQPSEAQQVWQVDELGIGGAFTDIQSAIDVASDGDVILVSEGEYDSFTLSSRSLKIIADTGPQPTVTDLVIIENVLANQSVEIQGFEIVSKFNSPSPLIVRDCVGPILFQDCDIVIAGNGFFLPTNGVRVTNSNSVTFIVTEFDGRTSSNTPGTLHYAIKSANSNSYFYDCVLNGVSGTNDNDDVIFLTQADFDGSPALVVEGGFTFLASCQITGGNGAGALLDGGGIGSPMCLGVGNGGPALLTMAGAEDPKISTLQSTFTSGAGGPGTSITIFGSTFSCPSGSSNTAPIELNSGSITTLVGFLRSYFTSPVVRPGEIKVSNYSGLPFEIVWTAYSLNQAPTVFMPEIAGTIFPGAPYVLQINGVLNFMGDLTRSQTLNSIGVDFIPLYQQAYFYDPATGFHVSNPRFTALIDD